MPTFRGLRVYAPDAVHGAVIGIGGPTAASYDATGHFARYEGIVSQRGEEGTEKGNLRRCPGGACCASWRTRSS